MTTAETISRPTIRQTQCFIGGEWIPAQSGKTFDTHHPATGEVIAAVAEGDVGDVDAAVEAARKAFDDHAQPERKRLLLRVWLNALDPRPMAPEFANQLNTGERGAVTLRQ